MQNTYKNKAINNWIDKQEDLIASLKLNPLIVVLRPDKNIYTSNTYLEKFLNFIESLNIAGVKHIEVAWSEDEEWICLMNKIRKNFPSILLGAASITSINAFNSILKLDLAYSMSPIWDIELQKSARELSQVIVPGVFSPSEINIAKIFGYRIIKLFPVSILGLNYLNQIKHPLNPIPFTIAAGGILPKDIQKWLEAGYDAVAVGRGLFKKEKVDPSINNWLEALENSPQ